MSIVECKLPAERKCANVTAIFKKGERKDPANYRPISLTSVPGKIMERLVRNTLVEHMVENNLFTTEQHGFITSKSCTTQMLEYMEDVTKAIDNGNDVDVIYLDFCKHLIVCLTHDFCANYMDMVLGAAFMIGLKNF